jgi:uncharacterized damage-inducible protein DinB
MVIYQAEDFLPYYHSVRERTMRVVERIPADKLEHRTQPHEFSPGDLARHIVLLERDFYLPSLLGEASRYQGCGPAFASTLDAVLALYHEAISEMINTLSNQPTAFFQEKCVLPQGGGIRRWKLLRLLLEHEIHHRGQLSFQLRMAEVPVQPLFGMSSEELVEWSQNGETH